MQVSRGDSPVWHHVVAGSGARCTVEAFMSPFHMMRVRLQQSTVAVPTNAFQWARAMATTMKEEGVGMWRGLPPRLMWVAPLSSVMFVYYEVARSLFHSAQGDASRSSTAMAAVAGPVALAMGTCIRTPFDIIEQRRQLVPPSHPTLRMTPVHHIQHVRATEGARAVLRGAHATFLVRADVPTLGVVLPYVPHLAWYCPTSHTWRGTARAPSPAPLEYTQMSSIFLSSYFLVYESTAAALQAALPQSPGLSFWTAGAAAGGVAAAVATPFDVVKTRLQTEVGAATSSTAPPATMRSVTRQLLAEGGAAALFRGLGPRLAAFTPAGGITFGSYELYKRLLAKISS